MFFDVSGRLLRDGKTQVMLVLKSHRHWIYSLKPKYIVDEHIGLGTVKLTDEEGHAEEFAWHFELVTTSFLRDIARRWRRKARIRLEASFRNRCRQALRVPSMLLPCMECKDMLQFRRAARACWKPGLVVNINDFMFIVWSQRKVVKCFTVADMLRYDPLHATSVLYLDLGVTVQMIPDDAPVQVAANGWLWVRYFRRTERYVGFTSGWIHPAIVAQ